MEELGILSQPFISSMDIMFLVVAGWIAKDLENFPPDVIRSLIHFELKKKATVDKFRSVLQIQKKGTFNTALKLYNNAVAA